MTPPPSYFRKSSKTSDVAGLVAIAGLVAWSAPAVATNCAVKPVDDSLCAASGANDICNLDGSGATLTCDLGTNSDASDAQGFAYLFGSYYEITGRDGAGNDFCCRISASGVTRLELLGTSNADTLQFTYPGGYNLTPYSGSLTGYISGRAGGDIIEGSYSTSASYLDDLRGGNDGDIIRGNDGGDTIYGEFGEDHLHGGAGDDYVYGGDSDDYITGGSGVDRIHGDGGGDQIWGDGGGDFLYGDEGADEIRGGDGIDEIHGGNGNDTLCGDDDGDPISGDGDDDEIYGNAGGDTVMGGSGRDYIMGGPGADILHGDDGGDYIAGNSGMDNITGDSGADELCGDEEPSSAYIETLRGGTDNDLIWGPSSTTCPMNSIYNMGGGDGGYDQCDNCSTPSYDSSCEIGLGSRPSGCPPYADTDVTCPLSDDDGG